MIELPKYRALDDASRTIADNAMAWVSMPEGVDGHMATTIIMPENHEGPYNGLEALMLACAMRVNDPAWVNEMHDWLRETGVMSDAEQAGGLQ